MTKKIESWKTSEALIAKNPNLSIRQVRAMLPNRTNGSIKAFRRNAGVRRISARDAINAGLMDHLSAVNIALKYDFDYEYISSLMVKVKKKNE